MRLSGTLYITIIIIVDKIWSDWKSKEKDAWEDLDVVTQVK